ncbi:MAG: Wzz/FepE/Etk N-terminal domain-containing protein [Rhodothermales bacterium]
MAHIDPSSPAGYSDAKRQQRQETGLWHAAGVLFRRRWLIVGITTVAAIAAVVITLLMPNWYVASARLMLPSGGGGNALAAAFLNNLPAAAQSLLGGGGGDYLRFMALIESRTVMEDMVETFDLVTVYGLEESQTPSEDALKLLYENLDLTIDDKYEYLGLHVADEDPVRAAELANAFVEKMEARNEELSLETASSLRRFMQQRFDESMTKLDSVLDASQAFQEQYGVFDLPTQTEAFFSSMGNLRIKVIEAEIVYETLLGQLGQSNPRVAQARDAMESAQSKYNQALQGREQMLPVPQQQLPAVTRQYINLERERVIQTETLRILAPILEQVRADEERETLALQVIDPAIPPVKKAGPRRSIICIAAVLSVFILSVTFVLLWDWWQRTGPVLAERLRTAAAASAP